MLTYEFTESRLDNGLRVIVCPDPLVPVVAVNIWYGVGSRHERAGRTGFAHLFEHLMFEGSAHVGKGEHFALVNAAGGTLNGSTWCDRTNYYEIVPSNHFELMLWLEADRMASLLDAVTQENLDNQRAVVQNERRQSYDNAPYGTWSEKMHAHLFPVGHPYHHSTIGSMADLEAATLDDVHAFFRAHYAPDNAVLSIVGDVDAGEARKLAERHFGPIRAHGHIEPPPSGEVEPHIGSEIRETVEDRVSLERVYTGWRVPPYGTRQFDALLVGLVVLGRGRGSRLHRRLVLERAMAQGVMTEPLGFVGGASMAIGLATARRGVPIAEVEAEFHDVTASLATDPPSDAEMDRARALLEREVLGQMQQVGERADAFSEFATLFDDPGLVNRRLDQLLDVTAGEVAAVAADRLRADNRAVLTYVPQAAA